MPKMNQTVYDVLMKRRVEKTPVEKQIVCTDKQRDAIQRALLQGGATKERIDQAIWSIEYCASRYKARKNSLVGIYAKTDLQKTLAEFAKCAEKMLCFLGTIEEDELATAFFDDAARFLLWQQEHTHEFCETRLQHEVFAPLTRARLRSAVNEAGAAALLCAKQPVGTGRNKNPWAAQFMIGLENIWWQFTGESGSTLLAGKEKKRPSNFGAFITASWGLAERKTLSGLQSCWRSVCEEVRKDRLETEEAMDEEENSPMRFRGD